MENKTESAELRLLDVKAAVAHLAELGAPATVNFVRTIIVAGEIRHVKIGRKFFVTSADISEWVMKHLHKRH